MICSLTKITVTVLKLTPAQYRIMYYVRYTAPLLESLKDDWEGWYQDDSLYEYPEVRHC